ncbi:hypothetical protein Zm00014a_020876 [Zea mays]|uniref:Uncharacterized protein n=1 Tax=Zea mays TaxID=4577 RepID=A0A3L6DKY8_MAIZE|nr:hypothetical protein Zm00014a_020876 [Zea mays]
MQRHDFVNQRCATLQRYLRRLAVVGHSPVLHAFLTATGPNGIPTSDEWESGRDFFRVFNDLKQTVANGLVAVAVRPPPVEEEIDTKYLVHKARLEDLEKHLVTASQQVGKLESVSSRGMDQERSRYQKIEELKETVRAMEDAKTHALEELGLIKENNMNEIKRFNKERRQERLCIRSVCSKFIVLKKDNGTRFRLCPPQKECTT